MESDEDLLAILKTSSPKKEESDEDLLAILKTTPSPSDFAVRKAKEEDEWAKFRAVQGSVYGTKDALRNQLYAGLDTPKQQTKAAQQMVDAQNLQAKAQAISADEVSKPPPEIPGGTSRAASVAQALDLTINYPSRVRGSLVTQRAQPIAPGVFSPLAFRTALKEAADLSKPTFPEALGQYVEKYGEAVPVGPKQQFVHDVAGTLGQAAERNLALIGSPTLAGFRAAIEKGGGLTPSEMGPVFEAAMGAWEEYKKPLDPGPPATKTFPGPLGTRITPEMAAIMGTIADVADPSTSKVLGGVLKLAKKALAPVARGVRGVANLKPLRPYIDPIKTYVGGTEAELGLASRTAREAGFDPGITPEKAAFEYAAIGPAAVKEIRDTYAPIAQAMKQIPPAAHEFVWKWAQAETPQARAVVEATLRQTSAGQETIEALEKVRSVLGDEIVKNNLKRTIKNYFPEIAREEMLPKKIHLGSAKLVPGETGAHKERTLMKDLEKSITPPNLRLMDKELADLRQEIAKGKPLTPSAFGTFQKKILRLEKKAEKAGETRPLPIETPQRANLVLQEELAKGTNPFVEDLSGKYKKLREPKAQFYETDPAKVFAQHGIASAVEGAHRGFLRDVGKKFVVQAKHAPEGFVDVADLGRTRKIISDELGSGFVPKEFAELLTKNFEPTKELHALLKLPRAFWKIGVTLMRPAYYVNNYLTSLTVGLDKYGLLGWKRANDAVDLVKKGESGIISGTGRTAAEIKHWAERAGTLGTGGPPAFAARALRETVGLDKTNPLRSFVNELGEIAASSDESNRIAFLVAELRKNGGNLEAAGREAFRHIVSTANKTPLERHLSVPFPFITWPKRAMIPTAERVLKGEARLTAGLQNLSRALVPQSEQMHESFMPPALAELQPIQTGRKDVLGTPEVIVQRFGPGGTLGLAEPALKAAQALVGKATPSEIAESIKNRLGALLSPVPRGAAEWITGREFITQAPLVGRQQAAAPILKAIYEISPKFAKEQLEIAKVGNQYYTDAGLLNSIARSIPLSQFVNLGVNLISRSSDPEETKMSLLRAVGFPIMAQNPRYEAMRQSFEAAADRAATKSRQKRLKLRP